MFSVVVEESSVTRPPPLEDRMHSPPIQEKQSPVMAEAALAQMEAMHEQETTAEKPLPAAIDRAVTLSKEPAFTATLTVNDLAPLPTQEDLAELVPLLPEMALDPVPAAKLASEAPDEVSEPAPSVETVQQAVVRDFEEQEEVLQNAAQQKGPFELTMLAASTMPASTGWGRPPAMRPRQAGVPLSLARRALRRVPKKFFQEEARLLLWSGNGHFLLECLRYLLAADFGTAPELFRTVVARAVTAASAGLEDLDELLRRAYAALPLEALAALWAAAVEEVGLCSDGRAAAGYRLNYTQFSQAFFKSMPGGGSSPATAAFRSPQPGSATAQTLTASFKSLRRDFQHDRHRRHPSPWNSRSPRPLVTKGKPPKEPRPDPRTFSEALAFLVQGTDEGAVRLGLQLARSRACCKVLHTLFEVRDRDRHHLLFGKEDHDEDDEEELLHDRHDEMAGKKMTRQDREEAEKLALRQKMRGSEMDFVNFSKDWHHVKSAPGPPCVIVEYPQGAGDLDWQQDVQVQEFSEWRYIHKLVDGIPTTSYEECTDLIVVAVREGITFSVSQFDRMIGRTSEPQGEHYQHQLEFLSDSLSDLRVFESTAGGEHHPHQLDFLSELRVFESTAGIAIRPNDWDGHGGPQGEHHQHQLDFVSDSLSDLRVFESATGVPIRPKDWTDIAIRTANPHQLDFLSDSLSDPRVFESTAGIAIRPNDWAEGEHRQHQLDFLSDSLSDLRVFESATGVPI
ncbi:ccnl1 [Symbiodinium sp. CCMP2592]|nr:ccnl1 [Symbiodinium sp. CCMP2592]